MIVKKLTNTSEMGVKVNLVNGDSFMVPQGGFLENVNVENLSSIREFVRVEEDLCEVPVFEGRIYLKG